MIDLDKLKDLADVAHHCGDCYDEYEAEVTTDVVLRLIEALRVAREGLNTMVVYLVSIGELEEAESIRELYIETVGTLLSEVTPND